MIIEYTHKIMYQVFVPNMMVLFLNGTLITFSFTWFIAMMRSINT